MTKIVDMPEHNISIYKAVINPQTSSPEVKYVVVIAPLNSSIPVGTSTPLSELDWVNFQTRSTSEPEKEFNNLRLKPQTYEIPSNNILHERIKCVSELKTKWIYECKTLPLKLEILIEKEDENFASEGTIIGALELFQTTISFSH